MAFGFGSSSSASSSINPNEPPPAPTRQERKACWAGRDAYFDCLNANNVIIAGDENKVDGKEVKGGSSICQVEREGYHKNCGQTWIDYFNKRRILEYRQRATLQAAAAQGVTVPKSR